MADHLLNVGQRDEGVNDSWFLGWFSGGRRLRDGQRQFLAGHSVARLCRSLGDSRRDPLVGSGLVHRPERLNGTTPSRKQKPRFRKQIHR